MTLLAPLGLLALIGIGILILIYLLKPNYQQKVVSSTLVWRLSLRYRKRKLPINIFRNILILLCQILIIASSALILTQPVIQEEGNLASNECILIVDASASMQASYDHRYTRFERALDMIQTDCEEMMNAGGLVTIIYADSMPRYVCQRASVEALQTVLSDVQALECTYGEALIDEDSSGSAMSLAETVLEVNPNAVVRLYTDVTYNASGIVKIVDVTDSEWNAAILGGYADYEEPYFRVYAKVACYGKNERVTVRCRINGLNGTTENRTLDQSIFCMDDKEYEVDFSELVSVYQYESITFYLSMSETDSYSFDDSFILYGGKKPDLRIQYYSADTNPFYATALDVVANVYLSKYYNVYIKEVPSNGTPAMEGFDFYLFESAVPTNMPTDGVVFLVNPNAVPNNLSGIRLIQEVAANENTASGGRLGHTLRLPEDTAPIAQLVKYIVASELHVNRYVKVSANSSFVPLLYNADTNDPVYFVKNDQEAKVAILTFGVRYSDISISVGTLPLMVTNLFDYFLPIPLRGFSYEIGDTVSMTTGGEVFTLQDPDGEYIYDYNTLQEPATFPVHYTVEVPGTYTLITKDFYPSTMKENVAYFYVRTPENESNICLVKDELNGPVVTRDDDTFNTDLLIYFASALVALLFLEWLLQLKEHF